MMNKYFICIKVFQNGLCNSYYDILTPSAYVDDMRFYIRSTGRNAPTLIGCTCNICRLHQEEEDGLCLFVSRFKNPPV